MDLSNVPITFIVSQFLNTLDIRVDPLFKKPETLS